MNQTRARVSLAIWALVIGLVVAKFGFPPLDLLLRVVMWAAIILFGLICFVVSILTEDNSS